MKRMIPGLVTPAMPVGAACIVKLTLSRWHYHWDTKTQIFCSEPVNIHLDSIFAAEAAVWTSRSNFYNDNPLHSTCHMQITPKTN
jgi:hypothetical protein